MTDRTYRNRDKMTLKELIKDVEDCHFRTPYDTGASSNAMLLWNIVREYADLEPITKDDLVIKYYVHEKDMSPSEARAAHKEFEDWYRNRNK